MFNTGSQPTVMKLVVESAHSGLEAADYSTDSNQAKVSVWVRAFSTESARYNDIDQYSCAICHVYCIEISLSHDFVKRHFLIN